MANAHSPGWPHTEIHITTRADFKKPFGRDTRHSQSFQSQTDNAFCSSGGGTQLHLRYFPRILAIFQGIALQPVIQY